MLRRFLLLCPCVSCLPLSDFGPSHGVRVFDVLAQGGAITVQVVEHEQLQPRRATRSAFVVGMGPLPLHQEPMDLFVQLLAMPKPVLTLDGRWHLQFAVFDGVFSFIAYIAVALDPHLRIITEYRLSGRFVLCPFLLFLR